jgi:hypothetical protein
MKKAVNHALGRTLQDGGQCMSNGFQLLCATTTVGSVHEFLRCARTLQKKCWYSLHWVDPLNQVAYSHDASIRFPNTAGDCLARMVLVTANHNPHAC